MPCFYFFFLLPFCALHTHCLEFYFDFSIGLFKIVALGITLYIHNLLQCTSVEIWRRQWHPTPVLLPGKSHGQRRLVGYSPWGCKESDTTEGLNFFSFFSFMDAYPSVWVPLSKPSIATDASKCPTYCHQRPKHRHNIILSGNLPATEQQVHYPEAILP